MASEVVRLLRSLAAELRERYGARVAVEIARRLNGADARLNRWGRGRRGGAFRVTSDQVDGWLKRGGYPRDKRAADALVETVRARLASVKARDSANRREAWRKENYELPSGRDLPADAYTFKHAPHDQPAIRKALAGRDYSDEWEDHLIRNTQLRRARRGRIWEGKRRWYEIDSDPRHVDWDAWQEMLDQDAATWRRRGYGDLVWVELNFARLVPDNPAYQKQEAWAEHYRTEIGNWLSSWAKKSAPPHRIGGLITLLVNTSPVKGKFGQDLVSIMERAETRSIWVFGIRFAFYRESNLPPGMQSMADAVAERTGKRPKRKKKAVKRQSKDGHKRSQPVTAKKPPAKKAKPKKRAKPRRA